jgi:hypothetical protein
MVHIIGFHSHCLDTNMITDLPKALSQRLRFLSPSPAPVASSAVELPPYLVCEKDSGSLSPCARTLRRTSPSRIAQKPPFPLGKYHTYYIPIPTKTNPHFCRSPFRVCLWCCHRMYLLRSLRIPTKG